MAKNNNAVSFYVEVVEDDYKESEIKPRKDRKKRNS